LRSAGRMLARGRSAPVWTPPAPAARDVLGARARLVSRAGETSVPSCRPDMTMPGTAEAIPGICHTRPCSASSRAPHPVEVVIRHVVHHRVVSLIAQRLSGGRRLQAPGTTRVLRRPHASILSSLLEPPHLLHETRHAVALVAVDEPHLGRAVLLQNEVAVLVASLLRRRRRDIQQLRKRLDCPHTIATCVLQRGVDATFTFSLQLGGLALLHLQLGLLLGDLRTQLLKALEAGLFTHHIHSISSTHSVLLWSNEGPVQSYTKNVLMSQRECMHVAQRIPQSGKRKPRTDVDAGLPSRMLTCCTRTRCRPRWPRRVRSHPAGRRCAPRPSATPRRTRRSARGQTTSRRCRRISE